MAPCQETPTPLLHSNPTILLKASFHSILLSLSHGSTSQRDIFGPRRDRLLTQPCKLNSARRYPMQLPRLSKTRHTRRRSQAPIASTKEARKRKMRPQLRPQSSKEYSGQAWIYSIQQRWRCGRSEIRRRTCRLLKIWNTIHKAGSQPSWASFSPGTSRNRERYRGGWTCQAVRLSLHLHRHPDVAMQRDLCSPSGTQTVLQHTCHPTLPTCQPWRASARLPKLTCGLQRERIRSEVIRQEMHREQAGNPRKRCPCFEMTNSMPLPSQPKAWTL